MFKADVVAAVAAKTGSSKAATAKTVDAVFDVITEALAAGEKVSLTGFGTFESRDRQERQGVNPQSGAKITIPATKTPGFKAGTPLKNAVRGQ